MTERRITTKRLRELCALAAERDGTDSMARARDWRDIYSALMELRGKRFEEANPGDTFEEKTQ